MVFAIRNCASVHTKILCVIDRLAYNQPDLYQYIHSKMNVKRIRISKKSCRKTAKGFELLTLTSNMRSHKQFMITM